MFTGIVEEMGVVETMEGIGPSRRLRLHAPLVSASLEVGASVAVNGACLTAVDVEKGCFSVEIVGETVERTNLGSLRTGDSVNLERSMRADGRFDGHIVQGHVDGVGTVVTVIDEEMGRRMVVEVPGAMVPWIVEKGSITVSGVSLTVAAVFDRRVEIALIPHTLEVTTLGDLRPGDPVNLEGDILGKYVERLLEIRS